MGKWASYALPKLCEKCGKKGIKSHNSNMYRWKECRYCKNTTEKEKRVYPNGVGTWINY